MDIEGEAGKSSEKRPKVPDRAEATRKLNDLRRRTRERRDSISQKSEPKQADQSDGPGTAESVLSLGTRLAEVEAELARLQAAPRELRGSGTLPLTPPYLANAVVAVENQLQDMERFTATGDEISAQQAKVAAAMRCCSTLRRLCDDGEFVRMLVAMGTAARGTTPGRKLSVEEVDVLAQLQEHIDTPHFRDIEIELLQISGLPGKLAETHIDLAVAAFHQHPESAMERLANPAVFLEDLDKLRDASCHTAQLLSQSVRQQRTRQRLKKLLALGLGGTLIAAVNGAGTALLGPIGVAASGALGSAAIGVALEVVF